jgi:hypothetical protein
LDLEGCQLLTRIDALAGLTALTWLNLGGCRGLTSIDALAGLTALTSLDLTACHLGGFESMRALLPTLTTLCLYKSTFND